jgi:hypothetical protein
MVFVTKQVIFTAGQKVEFSNIFKLKFILQTVKWLQKFVQMEIHFRILY